MIGIIKGQRVKLSARGRRVFSKGSAGRSAKFWNWGARTGIVKHVSIKGARVVWSGNKSACDVALPISLLEPVGDPAAIRKAPSEEVNNVWK